MNWYFLGVFAMLILIVHRIEVTWTLLSSQGGETHVPENATLDVIHHVEGCPDHCIIHTKPVHMRDGIAGFLQCLKHLSLTINRVRAFLLDAPGAGFGGSGTTCDWQLAAEVAARSHVILAGGLAPDNVAEAIKTVHPWGVDVSTGVEASVGKKDPTTLRAGMTVTIEPGVYVEGVGGIRIEDTVLVTPAGCEVLTPTSKEFVSL